MQPPKPDFFDFANRGALSIPKRRIDALNQGHSDEILRLCQEPLLYRFWKGCFVKSVLKKVEKITSRIAVLGYHIMPRTTTTDKSPSTI